MTTNFSGKTYELTIDNGVVFRNTYSADGTTLHYKTLSGPQAGSEEDVDLHAEEINPGIFLVGWVEASGMTITHAMNLNTNMVHAFWTYETHDGRAAELHIGRLREL